MFKKIRMHLADNRGDENVSKLIWVAIVFVVGGILLTLFKTTFEGTIKTWYENVVNNWFKDTANRFTIPE